MSKESYIGEVIEQEGELLLTLPVELINQMGWDGETILDWELTESGAILKEAEPK